ALLTIPRHGAAHDGEGEGEYRSASELRAAIGSGREVREFMPGEADEVYGRERDRGRGPVQMTDLEPMLLSRLRMLGEEAFNGLPDA
ncbi:MAG TPA: hypothetical protein DC001_07060, partial [Clostridiales bacterium]|nr:hypothetical protein [Clostridiales bacterium]